jgi:predicted transcriptional regulator
LLNMLSIFCQKRRTWDGVENLCNRKLREAQGELSQRAFARKLGISSGLVARLTTAPEDMRLSTLQKISRALHVTPSQLLDESDNHHRKG